MSHLRHSSFAVLLSMLACGGVSQRKDGEERSRGGASGLGGGGAATGGSGSAARGGSGGAATGGAALGGSGATAGELEGDYWIEGEPDFSFYVTVTSPTEALVGRAFEDPFEYDIVHTPGAPLGPDQSFQLSDVELTGEYVLRRRDGSTDAFVFALESSADTSRARLSFATTACHIGRTHSVYEVSAIRDESPPEARVEPDFGIAPPWRQFFVQAKRPVLAPLSEGFRLLLDGSPASVTWVDGVGPFSSSAGGKLDDWLPFVGRSLELRGGLHGTNGINSELLLNVNAPDFGRHEGPIRFAELPPDVALWGGVTHHAPGTLAACPDGCVQLTNGANVGMRFIRPGASLLVTGTFYGPGLELMAADGTSATVPIPVSPPGVIQTAYVAIPFETDDLFVVFREPFPTLGGVCPTPLNVEYLVSVEPAGVP